MSTLLVLLLGWFVPQDVVLDDVQYGGKPAGHATYAETVMDVIYPLGTGPRFLGHLEDRRPVVVLLRGGNSNKPLEQGASLASPDVQEFRSRGYVVVDPAFKVLVPNVDPPAAANADVGRVVQYLRAHAFALNLDPQRIIMIGRSMGALQALAVGLGVDFQQPPSRGDWVASFSSRPDAVMERSGMTDMSCFDPAAPILDQLFPGLAPPELTAEVLAQGSPTWWLAHPADYDRPHTPLLGVATHLNLQSPCGTVIDPHDGTFGLAMHQAIAAYALSGQEPDVLEGYQFVDMTPLDSGQIAAAIADWADALPLHD